jgi:hypothetical protein
MAQDGIEPQGTLKTMVPVFRRVVLPADISGELFLHSMPGRYEAYSDFKTAISSSQVELVICLAPLAEIQQKSTQYFLAIQSVDLPCERRAFEIPDFGVPPNRVGFVQLAQEVADRLKSGARILIHCAGGIGRTGTFAVCVLVALGFEPKQACQQIADAGSRPETQSQRELILWAAKHISEVGT